MAVLPSPGSEPWTNRRERVSGSGRRTVSASRSFLATVRSQLDTPMASLYLVLVSAGLLIALGMMMVLHAVQKYSINCYSLIGLQLDEVER